MINGEKQYINSVAARLRCPAEKKNVILSCIQDTIAERDLTDADYTAIVSALGEPESIAQEYVELAVPLFPSVWRRVITAFIVAQVVAVVIFGAYLIYDAAQRYIDLEKYRNGFYVETLSVGELIPVESDTSSQAN